MNADLSEIRDSLARIEKLLERICPPAEQISVAEGVAEIRRKIKERQNRKDGQRKMSNNMNEKLGQLNELNRNLLGLLQQSDDLGGHYTDTLLDQVIENTLNMKRILAGEAKA